MNPLFRLNIEKIFKICLFYKFVQTLNNKLTLPREESFKLGYYILIFHCFFYDVVLIVMKYSDNILIIIEFSFSR